MVMTKKIPCTSCGKEERRRNLRKVKSESLCHSCYVKHLKKRRQETIEVTGVKRELMDLKNKYARELRLKHRKPNTRKYTRKLENLSQKRPKSFYEPFVKAPKTKKKPKINSFITLEERRTLLRIIMSKGIEFEEAIERVSEIIKEQSRIRGLMKEQGKSEQEIKVKQQEMLEELWKL
jgi:hypothetical protein